MTREIADDLRSPDDPERVEAARAAIEAAAAGEGPQVLRRDLPQQPPTGPEALPAWAVNRAVESIGPLSGGLGQQVNVDVFPAAAATTLRRASASAPFLIIAGPAPDWDAGGNGTLGAGSVWILAGAFDTAAPASGWIGLTIDGGAIIGASPTPGPDGVLVVADALDVELDLALAPPAGAVGGGPGEDARQAEVRMPEKVVLTLAATTAVKSVGPALVTAYGSTVRLGYKGGAAPVFVPEIAAVLVPMQRDPADFNAAACESQLVALGGSGRVASAGWALPVTIADPATLGDAAGAGSLALRLSGLTLSFAAQATPASIGDAWLLAAPGLLSLFADGAFGVARGEQVVLYPAPGGGAGVGGIAALRYADQFVLRYLCDATGSETVLAQASIDVSLDRPVTAAGARVALRTESGVVGLVEDAAGTTLLLDGAPAPGPDLTVALANALVRLNTPSSFTFRATVTSETPKLMALAGAASINFALLDAQPTLPDPYASTTGGDARGASLAGAVLASLRWDATAGPAEPTLAFSLSGQAALGAAVGAAASPAAVDKDAQLLAGLHGLAQEAVGPPGQFALLDVSSAADQFGVRFGAEPQSLEGLDLVAPLNSVRVITLPAVQWEPVSGPDPSGPFTPMSFPDCGGESELVSHSVRLVPAAPVPALKELLAAFPTDGAVASVTFPFGIRAVALLQVAKPRQFAGAQLDLHRPGFGAARVDGGYQVRVAAVRRLPLPAAGPGLSGAAVQLSDGLHNAVPTGLSPIDPLTDVFNGEFAVGGIHQQVPVNRFELSGYGESLFSEWRDDTDDPSAISEVRFDVHVGRTGVEVVQARSILYPYAVRVIRAIRLMRDNAGRVQRTDSGWHAVTDGRYAWPRPDILTHPGVVLGVARVTNIRDTGQRWTSSRGTELMAVRFDCFVDLEGLVAGGGPDGVLSQDQLGFVQTSMNAQPGMPPAEFAELIEAFGPLGGGVDAVVDLGGSGLRSRVGHVGVGVTPGTTVPEFAMAAWGSPSLPAGGSWSVVRQVAGNPTPGPVDQVRGVPVIRAGYAGAPPSPASPYRFADPQDLATPSTPAADYALMHSTGLHRVLFPRPKVDLSGPRAKEISSTEPPVLADAFVRAIAVGAFPPVASAIRFPDADYGLRPLASGELALDLAHNDFPVTGGDRILRAAAGTTTFVRYRDEGGNPATVHLEIDGSQPVPWRFALSSVELCVSTAQFGEVLRLLGSEDADAAQAPRFTGGTLHLGPALHDLEKLIGFLATRRMPELPLGVRNQPSVTISSKFPIVDQDTDFGKLEADLAIGVQFDLSAGTSTLKIKLDGFVSMVTDYPPLTVAGQTNFEVDVTPMGTVFKLTIGAGIGVKGSLGPFQADAYLLQNTYLVVGATEVGLGVGLELKGSIDVDFASVEVDAEALGLLIVTTCPPAGPTGWLVGQMTVGVDVSIAFAIDIDFEYQWQAMTNLNGGVCPPPVL
jgi:hypothetical protein